jgi:hypothetical protein
MNRREFLRNAGLASLGITLGGALAADKIRGRDGVFGVEMDDNNFELSYEEASALAVRFDRLRDAIPEEPFPASREDLAGLMLEVIPNFEYEGVTDVARFPRNFAFYPLADGGSHNHVAGKSNCADFVVNYRFANPISSWHESEDWIPTAIHELAHVQQGALCYMEPRSNIEQSAQIATLEVMAGMVNYGNEKLVRPLISELRGMAVSTAFSLALKGDRMNDFEDLRGKLSKNAISKAKYERTKRVWAEHPEELQFVLENYSEIPLNRMVYAIRENGNTVTDLALPNRELVIDDLAYFIGNAQPMVGQITK